MTSRRPMARSFSANGRTSSFSSNGRTSSFNEEESSSSNGRNTYLSNVRPETSYSRYSHHRPTRSTLCSVMAQLTEDIQPTFETTLKSKAVSENCNVKFTCVVSGYPAPEMKWYKDDMQMDRFCGLPKYEIRCNGKTHTLHIYNCTMDDAAIYQVSASNSKGIVSCSGVLEVGDMNEYKIHQRFFSKLKQKAEKKKTDLLESQTKKEVKESTQKEKPRVSPERPPRKRHVPLPEERPVVKDPESVEQLGAAAEPNNVSSAVKETAPMTSKDSGLETEISPDEKNLAAKKIKISNDVDSSSRSHVMGNGGENCYDGGFSLAQFLSETLQSQAADDKQNSPQGEKPKEMDVHIADFSIEQEREQERIQKEKEKQVKALEEEYKREKKREEELAIEREQERQLEISHKVPAMKHGSGAKQHSKAHKDHDHHVIQASISTMLHTVKDFLFGKSKKDSHDHNEKKERESDHSPSSTQPPKPETPPSFRLQQDHNKSRKSLTEDVVPMEVDKRKELSETVDIKQQSVSLQPHEHKCEDSILHKDLSSAPKLPPESIEESTGQCKEADKAVEAMEGSVGPKGSGPEEEMSLPGLQGLNEAEQKYSQKDSFIKENPVHQQEPNHLVVSPEHSHLAAKEECSPTHISVLPHTEAPKEEEYSSTLTRWNESWTPTHSSISAANSHRLGEAPTETLQEEGISVDKMGKVGEPHTDEGLPSTKLCEQEKTEVKSNQQPLSDINRSEMAELTASSVEEIIETCKSKTPDQVVAPPSAIAACSVEGEKVEEKIERASLIQEMKVGFPPTVAPGSLDKGDLKIQQECTSSIAVERTEVKYLSEGQSSNSGSRSGEEKSELKEVLIYSLEKDLGVNSNSNLQTKEQVISESENTEPRNDCLPFKVETEKKDTMKLDELDKSKSLSVTQNNECNANVKEQNTFADKNNRERQQGWPSENTPQIQVSTFVDTPDIKPTTPDVNPNEHFIIPKIEIMEPELQQCILPPKSLPLNKQESELAILQNHDSNRVSEVINKNQSVVDSPSLLPKQTDMKKDYHPSPTQRVQDVAQLNDEPEVFEREQTSVKSSSEQLPQMDFASIPVINVSFTDDKEGDVCANNHFSDTQQPFETPGVPLFVVPPISVTCHESDTALPLSSQSELTETVTSSATQRETKHDVDTNMTPKPEKAPRKKHNPDKMADKSIQEALIPKVGDNVPSLNINISPEILKTKPLAEAKVEDSVSVVEDIQRNKSSPERLCCKPPTHPSLSPASLRRFMAKAAADSDSTDKADDDLSGGSTPTSSLSRESSPRLKRRDSLTLIRSATPEELASGARRKIFMLKPKEDVDAAVVGAPDTQVKKESPYMSPSQARRAALLQTPTGQNTPPLERRSPLLGRRKNTLEVPKVAEVVQPAEEPASTKKEEKPEKKLDPLKAPQVIRKIRGEPFPDASGHLKLWCQFFNVLSDSTIKWYRDEEEILEVKRSGGDESQVALAIVLACSQDCGVYGCTISNEYGTDTTDFLLSVDILSNTLLKDDLEVQEEIEMTPMLFAKGLGDSGNWGEKFFGRIMTDTVHLGDGCAHKASRVKVIYGLDPVFDSGSCCIIKIQNPIPYGTKQESNLTERNLAVTKQECKVQNMIREYCKIFAAEARLVENFGYSLEVIPQYLMYRPANTVPYGTVEAELKGVFLKYCMMDPKGRLITRSTSEVEQKCGTFQHWIHQWTHGNLLVTRLDGVETKITNVRVVTKSKGYQGLTEYGSPEVFEQFLTHHQCNYYCGLLGLPPLKTMDSQPSKIKGSRSPLLNRKLGSSPQLQRKGTSPQMTRKASSSPKVPKKVQESEDNQSGTQLKPAETVNVLEVR